MLPVTYRDMQSCPNIFSVYNNNPSNECAHFPQKITAAVNSAQQMANALNKRMVGQHVPLNHISQASCRSLDRIKYDINAVQAPNDRTLAVKRPAEMETLLNQGGEALLPDRVEHPLILHVHEALRRHSGADFPASDGRLSEIVGALLRNDC